VRRIVLLVGAAAVAVVLASAAAGFWVSSEGPAESEPRGELVFTRLVEVDKVTSEDGIVGLSGPYEDLYVVGVDGSNRRLLARNAGDAAVSPDGRRIAFARNGAVWIMQRDGSGARRLVQAASEPAWSPVGTTVYFSRWIEADRGSSLFSIRADGTHLVRLTRAKGEEDMDPERPHGCWQMHEEPSPSPDGRVVAFTEAPNVCEGLSHVRVVSPEGRPLRLPFRTLADGAGTSNFNTAYAAAWSPDGRQLAYGGVDRSSQESGLYLSRSDGTPTRRLVVAAGNPAWSPDSEWIAFAASRPPGRYPPNSGIWLVRRDGSRRRIVTRPAPCAVLDASTPAPPTRCASFDAPAWLPPTGKHR
jgi:Tol biopolymer transport system component